MKKAIFVLLFGVLSVSTVTARAEHSENDPTDCPPGSVNKTENNLTWCEPTVCESDSTCLPNEVCKPIPLCVQIGTVSGDAGATASNKASRLMATAKCGPDKSCPQTTTCSEKSRCIDRRQADKMGLLTSTAPAPSSSATSADAKKSSCGCSVVGADFQSQSGLVLGLFATLAFGTFAFRRRTRRD